MSENTDNDSKIDPGTAIDEFDPTRANSESVTTASERSDERDYATAGILQARFSAFRNSFDTEPAGETTLEELTVNIRSGKWRLVVEKLRSMKTEEYSQNKRNLPAVAFGGIFTKRRKDSLIKPSRLVVLDIDHIDLTELAHVKIRLTTDPHTVICFVSPSGKGLKAVFYAEFSDDATFKQAYRAIADYMKWHHNLTLDESGKDISRLCFVSYDQAVYFNPDASKFYYEVAAREPEKKSAERPKAPIFIGNYQQRYVLRVINGEIENVESAPRGGGNDALNIAAMKIGQFYYLCLFDKEAIKQHLTATYLRRGGSFKNQAEADSTFESGWLAGIKSPRAIPERGQL